MYKARYNQLPGNVQNKFMEKEGGYNLRGPLNFKRPVMHTTLKIMSISSSGVTLWNGLEEELKQSKNIIQFKTRFNKQFSTGTEVKQKGK